MNTRSAIQLIIAGGACLFTAIKPAMAVGEPGKLIDSIICKTDPTQSYALYIPSNGNQRALPVIYFFDPHGDGALPVRKYRSLADKFGFLLVGSNNSRNGNDWAAAEQIWRVLGEDTKNRLNLDGSRIYTCGFSGGAKVAGYLALEHPSIKGVIANGAALPDGVSAGDFPFSFTAITGEGDMNRTGLVDICQDLDKTHTRHHLLFFDGKHEWAPASCMNIAFAGLQLDAMQQGLLPRDEAFLHRFIADHKKYLDYLIQTHQWLRAGQECRLSKSFLEGLSTEAGWFMTRMRMLEGNMSYQRQMQEEEHWRVTEENIQAEYRQHFQQGGKDYWAKVIDDLNRQSRLRTPAQAMDQRLLAYLSLAFYSLSNRLITSNNNQEARHFVELYKIADPGNSEAWYFSAILHAREGQAKDAEKDLLVAVKNGFTDWDRILRQPEFHQLSGQLDFSRIKGSRKAP